MNDERVQRLEAALHDAAQRVEAEAGSPVMDELAAAGALFLAHSTIIDEVGVGVQFEPMSIGYGVMLGWLAHEAARA